MLGNRAERALISFVRWTPLICSLRGDEELLHLLRYSSEQSRVALDCREGRVHLGLHMTCTYGIMQTPTEIKLILVQFLQSSARDNFGDAAVVQLVPL